MSRFDLIIFDCDGVLVDSEAVANDVLAAIVTRHGAALVGRNRKRSSSACRWMR